MFDTHVYEILPGELLFRRSGNGSRTFITCKIVRTRAIAQRENYGWNVGVDMLTTGYDNLVFKEWFSDWDSSQHNLHNDKQTGRQVEVAIEVNMLDKIIQTGRLMDQHQRPLENESLRPFGLPLVAVRIDTRWIEPVMPLRDMSTHWVLGTDSLPSE